MITAKEARGQINNTYHETSSEFYVRVRRKINNLIYLELTSDNPTNFVYYSFSTEKPVSNFKRAEDSLKTYYHDLGYYIQIISSSEYVIDVTVSW